MREKEKTNNCWRIEKKQGNIDMGQPNKEPPEIGIENGEKTISQRMIKPTSENK